MGLLNQICHISVKESFCSSDVEAVGLRSNSLAVLTSCHLGCCLHSRQLCVTSSTLFTPLQAHWLLHEALYNHSLCGLHNQDFSLLHANVKEDWRYFLQYYFLKICIYTFFLSLTVDLLSIAVSYIIITSFFLYCMCNNYTALFNTNLFLIQK